MLKLAVFLCGVAVMGIEMSASRLLAPYFGTSLFVWTNLIGSIMAALAAGYWLGGRLADKAPRPEVFYRIILASGVLVATIPYLAQPVMALSQRGLESGAAGLVAGSLAATIGLFAVPIVLLGMVSPFAIRLASCGEEILGKTAGSLYALSTGGSIVGTFLPALVTIPLLGTRRTILTFAAVLVVVGVAGLTRRRAALVGVLAAVAVGVAPFGPVRLMSSPAAGVTLEEDESLYHYIQVVERGGRRLLVLNEGQAVHSVYETRDLPWRPMVGSVWDSMMALPLLLGKPPGSRLEVLIIGLAAGTIAKELEHFYGKVYKLHVDGVEIDGRIVELGREYFAMNEPSLDVHIADGRIFLAGSKKKWDLVIGDAYRQPYVPFHLATREFFELVKAHLEPGGMTCINVGSHSPRGPVLQRIEATMASVFGAPSVLEVRNPERSRFNNYIVIGGGKGRVDPAALDPGRSALCRAMIEASRNEYIAELMFKRMADLRPAEIDPGATVLEDDRAPVEVLTDWMIFELAAGGDEPLPAEPARASGG